MKERKAEIIFMFPILAEIKACQEEKEMKARKIWTIIGHTKRKQKISSSNVINYKVSWGTSPPIHILSFVYIR